MKNLYRAQQLFGFHIGSLTPPQLDRLMRNADRIGAALMEKFRHELVDLDIGVGSDQLRLLSREELMAAVNDDEKAEAPKTGVEPGLPLRQFVRGFLRDHMGFSKILAHLTADLFMKRWNTARVDGTAKRYAEEVEDEHTRAATFDRRNLEQVDGLLGLGEKEKASHV